MNIENLANHFCFDDIFSKYQNKNGTYNWLEISKDKSLSTSFIDKYFHQISSYHNLERMGNLSNFIIRKYGNYFNWNILLMSQQVDENLIELFLHKINFKICVMFQDLSFKFLVKYKDQFKLKDLEKNANIKKETITNFKNYLAFFNN